MKINKMNFAKSTNYLITTISILIFISIFVGFFVFFNSPSWLITLATVYAINLVVNFILFVQDRHSDAKLSWFFILTFLPVIAHFFYFIFGQKYRKRVSKTNYDLKTKLFFDHSKKTDLKSFVLDHDLENLFEKQTFFTKRYLQEGNIEFITETSKVYDYIFDDLLKAKKYIHLHFYILKPGEIYEKFRELIIQKRNENVEIRLIIDDFGNWTMPWSEIVYFRKIGVEIYIFGKVYFPFIGSNNGYRTHRKMIIIDGEILHTGGINLSDEYACYNKNYGYWMDLNLRISGDFVQQYALLFLYDWFNFTKKHLDVKKYAPLVSSKENNAKIVLIEDSPENNEAILEASLISWINFAKKKIILSTPYFIPTTRLFLVLKNALLNGIEIEIFLPGLPDKKYVYTASLFYAKSLAAYGAKIHILNDMFLHAKFALFDDSLAYVGTMNIDTRSLYSQLETVNVFVGKEAIKNVEDIFKKYYFLSSNLEVNEKNLPKSKFVKLFAKLFGPLM